MESLPTGRVEASPAPSSCAACHLADHCAAASRAGGGPFRGVSLVGASALYFILPALLALLGAAIVQGGAVHQLIGGAAGMLLGMLVANVAARLLPVVPPREECFEPR